LRERLEPDGFRLVAPDLNIPSFERLDFRMMTKVSCWEIKKHSPAVVVGSSLGAMVALEASRMAPTAPMVLIAPAVGFGARWIEQLPPGDPVYFFHHAEGRELPIHRRFFELMARVEADREPPPVPVTIIMGTDDESVPVAIAREVWRRWQESGQLAPGSRFLEIPGGDHGLVDHVGRIGEEIRAAAQAIEKSMPSPSRP
jgi:pimeloyl-ACP methyl ester carboxylesterase